MKLSPHLAFLLLLATFFVPAQQTKQHPATYVDKGACPFECCTYRRWKTLKDTVAYSSPDKRSKRVGTFKKGSWVRGLTGEVRTLTPGKFVISKAHEKYGPGNVLWVYTRQGEGFYKVWSKGRMYSEEMEYMVEPGQTMSPSCADDPNCWGALEGPYNTIWWVKVRSSAGWIGWTMQTDNFGNMDSCG
jgi:hypothetical protein